MKPIDKLNILNNLECIKFGIVCSKTFTKEI